MYFYHRNFTIVDNNKNMSLALKEEIFPLSIKRYWYISVHLPLKFYRVHGHYLKISLLSQWPHKTVHYGVISKHHRDTASSYFFSLKWKLCFVLWQNKEFSTQSLCKQMGLCLQQKKFNVNGLNSSALCRNTLVQYTFRVSLHIYICS